MPGRSGRGSLGRGQPLSEAPGRADVQLIRFGGNALIPPPAAARQLGDFFVSLIEAIQTVTGLKSQASPAHPASPVPRG